MSQCGQYGNGNWHFLMEGKEAPPYIPILSSRPVRPFVAFIVPDVNLRNLNGFFSALVHVENLESKERKYSYQNYHAIYGRIPKSLKIY